MAVYLEFSYGKRWGLPAYSSHSFNITLRSEVGDLKDVEAEACRVYALLQNSVDRNIVESGLVPDGHANGSSPAPRTNGHSTDQPHANGDQSEWACSIPQKNLILKIVEEHKIEKQEVEALAKQMFNAPVKCLHKMDASSLIAELLAKYGPKKAGGNGNGRSYQRGGARR